MRLKYEIRAICEGSIEVDDHLVEDYWKGNLPDYYFDSVIQERFEYWGADKVTILEIEVLDG